MKYTSKFKIDCDELLSGKNKNHKEFVIYESFRVIACKYRSVSFLELNTSKLKINFISFHLSYAK
jgi:hypothetical protein